MSLFASNLNTTPICALWFFLGNIKRTRKVRGWYILLQYIHCQWRFLKAYLRLMNVCNTTEKIRVNWNSFQRNEKYFHMLAGDLLKIILVQQKSFKLKSIVLAKLHNSISSFIKLNFYRRYSCWFQIISFTLSLI